MMKVELFDGTVLEFPEGTSQDVIDRVARQETMSRSQPSEPAQPERTVGQTIYENVIGSGAVDTPGERLGQAIGETARSFGAGVARGAAELAGLPGTLGDLLSLGAEKVGLAPEGYAQQYPDPFSGQSIRGALSGVTGGATEYRGEGIPARIAGTVGEFMGGGAGGRVGLIGGGASELAGMATEGTPLEPYARLAGGIVGSVAATPRPTTFGRGLAGGDEEAVAMAQNLSQRGITPTAGQIADNRMLMALEGTLAPTGRQIDDFTAAALREAGSDARRATPGVLREAQTDITKGMNDILSNVDVPVTSTVGQRAVDVASDYFGTSAGGDLPVALRRISSQLEDLATQPGTATIPASRLREWRTTLGSYTTSAQEGTRDAAHALREIIDDATEETLRSLGREADISTLADLRTKYRNFLAIADASTRGGREGARGILTPERLQTAVSRVQGRTNYATGRGTDLATLAREGMSMIGAAPAVTAGGLRNTIASALPLGTAGALGTYGTMVGGPLLGVPMAIAGAAAPSVGQAMMRSGPVQTLLSNPAGLAQPVARSIPGLLSQQ